MSVLVNFYNRPGLNPVSLACKDVLRNRFEGVGQIASYVRVAVAFPVLTKRFELRTSVRIDLAFCQLLPLAAEFPMWRHNMIPDS